MKFYLPLLTRHHRERSGTPVFENSHLSTSFSFPRSPSAGCGGSRVSQWISSWSPETEEEKKIIIPSHVMVGASLIALLVKNPPAMQETQEMQVQSLGREDPLEEGMATHFSILAWRMPWTEEPGRIQVIRLKSIGHD